MHVVVSSRIVYTTTFSWLHGRRANWSSRSARQEAVLSRTCNLLQLDNVQGFIVSGQYSVAVIFVLSDSSWTPRIVKPLWSLPGLLFREV